MSPRFVILILMIEEKQETNAINRLMIQFNVFCWFPVAIRIQSWNNNLSLLCHSSDLTICLERQRFGTHDLQSTYMSL